MAYYRPMKQMKVSLPDRHADAVKAVAKILKVSQSRVIRECIERCESDIEMILLRQDDLLQSSKGL